MVLPEFLARPHKMSELPTILIDDLNLFGLDVLAKYFAARELFHLSFQNAPEGLKRKEVGQTNCLMRQFVHFIM